MIRKLTIVLLLVLIIFSSFESVSAQNASPDTSLTEVSEIKVPYQSVNPSDGMPYLFKRISEKLSVLLAFSNKNKINKYKLLANIRLSELKFIIENKKMGYFEKSTQRYFSTAGQLTELLALENTSSETASAIELLSSHIPVLTVLRDNYDPLSAEWRFVEDDINYVKGYIDKLSAK